VLSEALPGITWTASPDGVIEDEAVWADVVHPDDLPRVQALWRVSLDTSTPHECHVRLRTSGGAYRWYLSRAHPQFDERGAVVRWIGVGVDVDEQHRADEQREQFVRLADASDDFIVLGDLAGAVTYMNAAMLEALELESIEELRDQPRDAIFAPEDRAYYQSTILPTQLREGRWHGEFRLRTYRTGATIPILYNAFLLRDDGGRPAGLAAVSRDLRERRRLEIGMRALAETGAAMYGSLDFEGTVQNVASAIVKSFASICVVDAVMADGSIRSVAASNRGPQFARTMQLAANARNQRPGHPVWRAIRRGESTLVATIPKDWVERHGMRQAVGDAIDELDLRSLLFVPIRSQQDGGVYGALSCSLDGRDSRGQFTVDDLRFADEIAVRAGLAFDHARAYERERRIAVTLQEASLPRTLPTIDGLHLAADYRPGNSEATIGGDWYDAFVLDDGRIAITIGDILGNGLDAAVTMGKVRQAMQSVAAVIPDPSIMLEVADRTVRAQSADTYATAIAGILDLRSNEFAFASAGHPGPFVRMPDGTIDDRTLGGLLLGMREHGDDEKRTIAVPPGAMLVFFTDGLTEATRDIDEGLRRIGQAIARLKRCGNDDPAHALVEDVLRGEAAMDDVAVLIAQTCESAHPVPHEPPPRTRSSDRRGQFTIFSAPLAVPDARAKVITIASRFDEIVKVRRAVRALVVNADLPRETVELVELATGELVANAVDHGKGSLIDVSLRVLAASVVVAVTNDGSAFERKTADLSAMIYAERGRGLAILTAMGCTIAIEQTDAARCTVTATVPLA
jgi:PAS domain S-box-containing protein